VWRSSGRVLPFRQVFVTPHLELEDGTQQLSVHVMSFLTCKPSPTYIKPGMGCHST